MIKCVDAEALVTEAMNTAKAYNKPHTMINLSNGVIVGGVYNLKDEPICDVAVGVQIITDAGITDAFGLEQNITKSDKDGLFTLNLPAGQYQLMLYKSGYHSTTIIVDLEPESSTYLSKCYLVPINSNNKTDGKILGHVVDATTGTPINGATVKYKIGWNNKNGFNLSSLIVDAQSVTDGNGNYEIVLPIGAYTAEVIKEGYFTTYTNIIVSAEDRETYSVLSPIINENEYRVVLTWGEYPSDLDSHLTGIIEGKSVHVYYNSKEACSDGKIIASLDHDDTSSYGPETITFTLDDPNDTVTYYVYDFSNGGNRSSYDLSYSNATVTVYSGNNVFEPLVYNIQVGKQGTYWYVFEIKNNKLTKIDRIE